MRRWLVLLLAVAAAGCLGPSQPPDPAACSAVTVPAARAGDGYTYAAEGRYWSLNNVAYVDWSAVNPGTDQTWEEEGTLHLKPGSTIEVHVADRARPRLDLYARRPDAYQVTYWADEPGEPRDFPFKEEWVHAETGRLVQVSDRAFLVKDDRVRHFTRFQNRQPPMWMAPLVWDRTLTVGAADHRTYYDEDRVPVGTDRSELLANSSDGYRWRVDDVTAGEDGCLATVRVTASVGSAQGNYSGTLRFDGSVPMPVQVRWEIPWLGQPFTMSLQQYRPGDGPHLPAFDPGPLLGRGTGLEMRPPRNGFLYHGADVFTTDYDRAVALVKSTDHAQRWFESHPRARPYDVEHTVGAPGESTREQWSIAWADPASDDELSGIVARENRTLGVRSEYEVSIHEYNTTKSLTPTEGRWATFGSMAETFRALYGKDPEVVSCRMSPDNDMQAECKWGTRRSVGSGGAGHSGDGSGFHMKIRQGWLVIDDPYSNASLVEPVR